MGPGSCILPADEGKGHRSRQERPHSAPAEQASAQRHNTVARDTRRAMEVLRRAVHARIPASAAGPVPGRRNRALAKCATGRSRQLRRPIERLFWKLALSIRSPYGPAPCRRHPFRDFAALSEAFLFLARRLYVVLNHHIKKSTDNHRHDGRNRQPGYATEHWRSVPQNRPWRSLKLDHSGGNGPVPGLTNEELGPDREQPRDHHCGPLTAGPPPYGPGCRVSAAALSRR